jgi:replicative DNA helicase
MSEWLTRSEVLAGKILLGQIKPEAVEPWVLFPPYDKVIEGLREGKEQHQLFDTVGMTQIESAKQAAKKLNGEHEGYINACKESALRVEVGNDLSPIIKRWRNGESRPEDTIKAKTIVDRMSKEITSTIPLSQADDVDVVWRPTGYSVWDQHFFGLPESSLTVIGAPPGTGKTSLLGRLFMEGGKQGKTSLFFSLEMTSAQVKYRFKQIDPMYMKAHDRQDHILVADQALTLQEIYAEAGRVAARHEDLHLIGVDFADMIIPEKWRRSSVDIVDETYRTMAALAKQLNVPVVVLSQLSGSYIGGRPRLNHLRGSRLIEALAGMAVMLYNPNQIDVDQEDEGFYVSNDVGWFILGKSRYGFTRSGLIAVAVHWKGERGWGDEHGLVKEIFSG